MKRKYLKLNDNDELVIYNNKNNSGVLIQSKGKKLIISEVEKANISNIFISDISFKDLSNFVLTKMLEKNHISFEADLDSKNIENKINDLLEIYNNKLLGINDNDIKSFTFQCIVEYED